MSKSKYFCALLLTGITGFCLAQQVLKNDTEVAEIEIGCNGEIDIYDIQAIFAEISVKLQKPILVEGFFPDTQKISITNKSEKVKIAELLSDICGKMDGFRYQITDKAILIQQDRFVKEKNYPLEIKMEMKQPPKVLPSQFMDELVKMRVFTTNAVLENKWGIAYQKYNGVKLRNVIIDILENRGVAWISLIPEEEKKELVDTPPVFPELVVNREKPFYELKFIFVREEKQPTSEGKDTVPTIEIHDGRKYLKMDSIFNEKDYSITLMIENSSDEELFFKDARNNIMIEEAYQDKRSPKGILTVRMLYPAENDPQFNDFVLAPKAKKEFILKLIEGRMKKDYEEVMYEMDSDKRSKIDNVPYEKGSKEAYDFSRPIAYFYDKSGKKYKSRGHEASLRK